MEKFKKFPTIFKDIKFFVDIDPREKNTKKKIEIFVKKYNFFGLNLHPRLNNFRVLDKRCIDLVRFCGKLNIPVVIDGFPDGNSLISDFKISDFGKLCKKCNQTNIILAHAGGIYCIEAMLMAKRIKNLYLNIAYTLLYYRDSSVTKDLIYCIKSLKGNKIFFGTDYPDRNYSSTIKLSIKELKKFKISKDVLKKIMYKNASEFIKMYEKS